MTPNEIRDKKFEKRMGGYKAEEVDAFLAQIADHILVLEDDKRDLEKKIEILAEKVEEYREDEESLRAALVGAQKLGDSVVRDAKRKADMILHEASAKAEHLVADAKNNIDREAYALTRMQGQVAEFKTQILNMYKRHIEMISALPEEPSVPKDVQEIVRKATEKKGSKPAPDQPKKAREKPKAEAEKEEVGEFALSFEEVDVEGSEMMEEEFEALNASTGKGASGQGKRSPYGNLQFGKEYNLTREDD